MLYISHLLVLCCIFSALASALSLLVGRLGELTLHQAALFGTGAYCYAILTTKFAIFPCYSLFAAAAFVAALSFGIAEIAWRLRAENYSMATLAAQMLIFTILYNWQGGTGGSFGISRIPSLMSSDVGPAANLATILPAVICLLIVLIAVSLVSKSPFGNSLTALREDELASVTIGKNPVKIRRTVQAFLGLICGFIGAIFASYLGYLHPSSFDLMNSTMLLAMVILGGSDRILGPVLGASVLILLPEALRSLDLPANFAAEIQKMLFGISLIFFAWLRPQGKYNSTVSREVQ